MASKLGPRIVTDNLVLSLDCADAKSYAGEPTTNLLGSNDNPLNGMSNITLTKIETQADGWIKYSMSGTFTGGTYPYMSYIDTVSFTGGTAYTSRAMIKTNVESKFNYFGSNGISYVNQPLTTQGTSRSVATEENGLNVYTVSREGFVYTSTTTQRGYLFTNPINNTTFNSSTDFMWIKNVQIEQKTYPTPWTYTSRSATDGWVDLSGNSNDGTLVNDVVTGTSHYRSGDVILPNSARYLEFDGSDDYINLPSESNFISGNEVTVEAWVTTDVIGSYKKIFITAENDGTQNVTGVFLSLGNSASTGAYFGVINASNTNVIANHGSYLSTGTWTHLTGTYDGSNVKIYINGSLSGTASQTGNIRTGSNGIGRISGYMNGNEIWDGKLASLKVYTKSLTATEVLDNYNSTKSRFS